MNTNTVESVAPTGRFMLCFRSFFQVGRSFAFPCNQRGEVDLDGLSGRARLNYFYARAMVGREVYAPAVELVGLV